MLSRLQSALPIHTLYFGTTQLTLIFVLIIQPTAYYKPYSLYSLPLVQPTAYTA